jgi:hypothetical protein
MPATLARVALITNEFRWEVEIDAAVAVKRKRARTMEAESFCTNLAGATLINQAVFALLKGDRQLIEVPVNPMPEGVIFNRLAPTATLVYEPLDLEREVIIVGKTSEVRRDGLEKGTLLVW